MIFSLFVDVQHASQANPVDSLKSYENCPEVNVVGGKYSQSDCLACTSNCVVLPNEEEVDEVDDALCEPDCPQDNDELVGG